LKRLKDYPDRIGSWPPPLAEVFSGYGFTPTHPAEIVLIGVVDGERTDVRFKARHTVGGCSYRIETGSEEFASRLRALLARHAGKNLVEPGELEIGEE